MRSANFLVDIESGLERHPDLLGGLRNRQTITNHGHTA
jgi:hypothetical protein